MSGGSFSYAYKRVVDFADQLERRLDTTGTDEPADVQAALTALLADARVLAERMRAAEWYYSADIGPETLLQRLRDATDTTTEGAP